MFYIYNRNIYFLNNVLNFRTPAAAKTPKICSASTSGLSLYRFPSAIEKPKPKKIFISAYNKDSLQVQNIMPKKCNFSSMNGLHSIWLCLRLTKNNK